MSRIVSEVWTRLAGERVQGEVLWARRAAAEVTERLIAALDADGKRHLLVLLRTGEADVQDSQSRGVGVTTRELAVPGHEAGRYLDVVCHDAAGHEAFDLIGGELAIVWRPARRQQQSVWCACWQNGGASGANCHDISCRGRNSWVCLRNFGFSPSG